MSFAPSRLVHARKRRGLTKKALAEQVGLTPRSVSGFENGNMDPSHETVRRLAAALGFASDYFFLDQIDTPSPDSVAFRSMSKMSARSRDAAIAAGASAVELSEWLDQHFVLPAPDVPDLRCSPSEAAMQLRAEWGLGERPIRNLVHLLESRGVRVFSLVGQCRTVDAFSFWREETPYVFLNTSFSSERSRFDAAHELGHLVLHRHGSAPTGQQAEREANDFASEFLMPRGDMLAHITHRNPLLQTLLEKKLRWGVAIAALTYRCHKLGQLSEWHYRRTMVEISKRGWRTSEPNGIPKETSLVLEKIFAALRDQGRGVHEIIRELQWGPNDLADLVFGLARVGIVGDGQTTKPRAPKLRVVRGEG